jgi:hypothetical protein
VFNSISYKNLQAQEFKLTFSINDLEKYLGEPVPTNAQEKDEDLWVIELHNENFIKQNINLLSENGIVIVAEYLYTSQSYNWLSGMRELNFNIIDENGDNKKIDKSVINWELRPNSGLKNDKYLLIGLTNVYGGDVGNNGIWKLSIRILDLNNIRERQRTR